MLHLTCETGSGGYKYFGAAKDLPGVRELFVQERPNAPRKSKLDLYRRINFEYYGLDQQEDLEMLKQEEEYEKEQVEKDLSEWIHENKDYVKSKLKGVAHPTHEQLVELVDDESIEEFKAHHKTGHLAPNRRTNRLLLRGSAAQEVRS